MPGRFFFRLLRAGLRFAVPAVALGVTAWYLSPLFIRPAQWKKTFLNSAAHSLPWDLEIQKISWGWQGRPQLVLGSVHIFSPVDHSLLLEAGQVRADISLLDLMLKRRVVLRHWNFAQPSIYLRKSRQGLWNWQSMPRESALKGAPFQLRFLNLEFQDAKIFYEDASAEPAFQTEGIFSSARLKFPQKNSPVQGEGIFQFLKSAPVPFRVRITYAPELDQLLFYMLSADRGLELYGGIQELRSEFLIQFHAAAHHQDLRGWSLAGSGFQGFLTAQLDGTSRGTHPAVLKRFLGLEGAADIRQGVFLSRNFLLDILSALRPVASVQPLLSKNFHGLFARDRTAFEIMQMNFQVTDGQLLMDSFRLKQRDYLLEGEGAWGLEDGHLDFRAKLVCMEDFSAWMAKENTDFKPFQNVQGRMVVPFLYRGLLPAVAPEMDWEKISKTAEGKI